MVELPFIRWFELCSKNEKKNNKQCLLDTPLTLMLNKENYNQEYSVYAKYQIVLTIAVVQVDFPTYALSLHKAPLKKQSVKNC